jgi:hypothetical protein
MTMASGASPASAGSRAALSSRVIMQTPNSTPAIPITRHSRLSPPRPGLQRVAGEVLSHPEPGNGAKRSSAGVPPADVAASRAGTLYHDAPMLPVCVFVRVVRGDMVL